MANNVIRVGSVEIMQLSDGMLEFDPCNFFPTIPEDEWSPYESHLTHEHKVRFNLGSYLIRAEWADHSRGHRPRPPSGRHTGRPWGELMRNFTANGVRPDEVDMVVMTHLHRDHVGWNLLPRGERTCRPFPGRATG